MPDQSFRGRIRSRLINGGFGYASPEWPIMASYTVAFAGGRFLLTAPRACKLVRVDYVADINGAGSSVIALNKHVTGQTAAANAALSGTNIVRLVTGDIPADSTVRVPVLKLPLVAANQSFATGAKLAIVTPATWAGCVTCYFVWL
jgi:hypothetical protein